jgi:hypothetical protein
MHSTSSPAASFCFIEFVILPSLTRLAMLGTLSRGAGEGLSGSFCQPQATA